MNLIGKVLSDRYEILEQVGVGGMAYVYKAKCRLLNRYVAIKVLKDEYSKDDMFVKRFKAEAQSAASLTHPNIVSVYDVGEENGISYIVMELLESRTLKDYIEEKGALSVDEIYKISIQIASALEAAHKQHIIHRDIKPQNIVLSKNLVAKVTDFGIAKATSTATITNFGNTMGSVHYFSPEHAKGGYTDEKSDIYSLGVVMYEMATGRVPFDSDSAISVALKHIQEVPKDPIQLNPNITQALNDIIMKAMAKNTASRFRSATDMLIALHDSNNKKDTKKSDSSVGAGKTQVLSVITDDMLKSQSTEVPNLRTRTSRRGATVTTYQGKKDDVDDQYKLTNINARREDTNLRENNDLNTNKVSKKKNNNKIMVITSIALIVLAVLIVTFFVVKIVKKTVSSSKVKEIEIPSVIGMTIDEINEKYSSSGISVEQTKVEYSSEYDEGKVISQSPEAGKTSATGKVYVVVSRGQNLVKVTDVKGKDIKVAKYELEDTLGFKVEIEYEKSDDVQAGNVISQSVEPDTEKQAGSTIVLKVSEGDGKEKVLMPNVVGKKQSEAVAMLEELKLSVTTKTGEDSSMGNGIVIAQSYLQNYELKEGDLVELTINRVVTSKTISIDIKGLLEQAGVLNTDSSSGNDTSNDSSANKTASVSVTASIDGGATNNVYSATVSSNDSSATFTINGYSTAILTYYVNGNVAKTETITF